MKINTLLIAAATCAVLSFTTSGAFAWGCSRSCSASTRGGGSVSHTSGSAGGYGGYAHGGSTTVTGREGNSYSTAHASGVSYGGTAYHGAACGGTAYHAGGCGTVAYGGCYSTGVGVGVVAAPVAYVPPATVAVVPVVPVAAVYHPYTPYAVGVYRRGVVFRR